MADVALTNGDLPCVECGYNLRGLASDGRCPECGADVADSIAESVDVDEAAAKAGAESETRRGKYEAVAASIGYPIDAVLFVQAALSRPVSRSGQRTAHVTARDVCVALREYAMWYFNDRAEALDLLAEWKVGSSEDVGRIIYGLAAAGMLTASPDDAQSDFDGLFVLGRLFDDSVSL
jgi:uncharacterized repeat protein (TIGR04138 family)